MGAGVVGLTIAKSLSDRGLKVLVIEKEVRSGESTSSRNSGVIHAGMYYPEKTLKADLCLKGNKLLYEYALEKKINHKRLGKIIIANTDEEILKLENIYSQGIKNKVNLTKVSSDFIKQEEPSLQSKAGILSPDTGIIDVPEYITALEGDIQHNQGLIVFNTMCKKIKYVDKKFEIYCESSENFKVESKILINSSGLSSDQISNKMDFLDKKFIYKINYAKGHYFKYSGKNPFKRLIYPVHSESSLGIHVGFDLSGQLRFGPDLTWVKNIDYLFDESLKSKFLESITRYWKEINPDKLQPDYCGIRPKIQKKNEKMKDFSILGPKDHKIDGFVNLQGIESPGVTSSLAIGKYVTKLLLKN